MCFSYTEFIKIKKFICSMCPKMPQFHAAENLLHAQSRGGKW